MSFFKALFISCLCRLRANLTLRLKDGRRLLSIKSMTLGDASREAKNSARFGCGLVMDDRPPLYLDATSIDDSFLVTLLQSSAWRPLSVFTNTRPVPLSFWSLHFCPLISIACEYGKQFWSISIHYHIYSVANCNAK